MSFLLQMRILKLTPLKGNCIVCELLMSWIHWMGRVICFVPSPSSSSAIKLRFIFLDEPFNYVLCQFYCNCI